MARNGWAWLAMARKGWAWLAMARNGWQWLAMTLWLLGKSGHDQLLQPECQPPIFRSFQRRCKSLSREMILLESGALMAVHLLVLALWTTLFGRPVFALWRTLRCGERCLVDLCLTCCGQRQHKRGHVCWLIQSASTLSAKPDRAISVGDTTPHIVCRT